MIRPGRDNPDRSAMDTCRIAPAGLRWNGDQPVSETFGDIYHAPDGAAEVARNFLVPADFEARTARLGGLRVGELGFGSGLNFIVAAERALAAGSRLHFVSFEAQPIAPGDFTRLAARRSSTHPLYAELTARYPPLIRGWHQRSLADGQVRLTVFWGDAAVGLDELESTLQQPIDAWFLDGFAPDRNPELWSESIFARIASLSTRGSTVTTFTAAGRVRRGLAAVGFEMRRVDQRPFKRESLAGVFTDTGRVRRSQPARVDVIGAGLAGSSIARQLAESGLDVRVYDPAPPGAALLASAGDRSAVGAGSALPTTVLHGRLLASPAIDGQLRAHAFLHAAAWAARFDGFAATGVLQLPSITERGGATADRLAAIAELWGDSGTWLEPVTAAQARELTDWPVDQDGLWFPGAGVVDTPGLCQTLLDHPSIELIAESHPLPAVFPEHHPIVLACGIAARDAAPAHFLELAPVYGQLDFVATARTPRAPVVGNGYLAPAGALLAAGATYEYAPWSATEATERNLQQLAAVPYDWRHHARGVRATTSDRVPAVGPLLDSSVTARVEASIATARPAMLYVSTGHGSMGNVMAHFAGALITAQITGEAAPMSPGLVAALAPERFRDRQRRRGARHGADRHPGARGPR